MNNHYSYPQSADMLKRSVWIVLVVVLLGVAMAFVIPWYNVWSQEMEGKAEFAKAEQNRKIKIEDYSGKYRAERNEHRNY